MSLDDEKTNALGPSIDKILSAFGANGNSDSDTSIFSSSGSSSSSSISSSSRGSSGGPSVKLQSSHLNEPMSTAPLQSIASQQAQASHPIDHSQLVVNHNGYQTATVSTRPTNDDYDSKQINMKDYTMSSIFKDINLNQVRNMIAQHLPEFLIACVIIIYLIYYFSQISKRPKLIGKSRSKFVDFIKTNLGDTIGQRFSPLIYFWGTNPQTALFGYLQGNPSIDEVPRSKFERQYLYVNDAQYLASNVDLSQHYPNHPLAKQTNCGHLHDQLVQLNANQLMIDCNHSNNYDQTNEQQSSSSTNSSSTPPSPPLALPTTSLLDQNIRLVLNNILKNNDHSKQQQQLQQQQQLDNDDDGGQSEDIVVSNASNGNSRHGNNPSSCNQIEATKQKDHKSSSSSGSSSDSGVYASCNHSTTSSASSSSSGSSLTINITPPQPLIATTPSSACNTGNSQVSGNCDCSKLYETDCHEYMEPIDQDSLSSIDQLEQNPTIDVNFNQQQERDTVHNVKRPEQLEFGQCALDWFKDSHKNYHKNKLVALISAGMTTGSDKKYVTDTVLTLDKLGYEVCVFIRRGVGGLKLSSTRFFSPSKWRDFEAAIMSIRKQRPNANLVAIGFSFGSIELCRYLVMSGSRSLVNAALLVSCPFDPEAGGRNMRKRTLNRKIDAYLAKNLGKQLYQALSVSHNNEGNSNSNNNTNHSDQIEATASTLKQHEFCNLNGSIVNLAALPKIKSLVDFEDNFNRVIQNYPNSDAYAADSRLSEHLYNIKTPTLCLSSEDDFMAPIKLLPIEQIKSNDNLCMILTKRGGHMAFIDGLVWPKKPYFAQRIISNYMLAVRRSFLDENGSNSSCISNHNNPITVRSSSSTSTTIRHSRRRRQMNKSSPTTITNETPTTLNIMNTSSRLSSKSATSKSAMSEYYIYIPQT